MSASRQEWLGGYDEGGMWCCYGWWAGQVVNDWQHEQGGGARVRWEVSLISLALGNPLAWGFEISRKCVYECVSLLCLCALEVPLKQERGGGGWTCHFREWLWCGGGERGDWLCELALRELKPWEHQWCSVTKDKLCVFVCQSWWVSKTTHVYLFCELACVCVCVNVTFELGYHCKI